MQEFILPDIGEGIVECELIAWLVKEGDHIEEDQPVAEVMTDKATVQIPAMYSGTVSKLHYQTGDIAKVHQPLFAMQVSGDVEQSVAQPAVVDQPVTSAQDEPRSPKAQRNAAKVLASPAVRRRAREAGIEIQSISGSGLKGRVLKEDLLVTRSVSRAFNTATEQKDTVEPLRGLSAAMAKQMSLSWQTIPHFTVTDECVMDNLMALRTTLQPQFAQMDITLSLLPFMLKALSLSLVTYPILNSSLSHDGLSLQYHHKHNIGFAVATEHGLIVPNIKDVASLSIIEIAQQVQRLIADAKNGQLSADDLQGTTITLSNIGPIGGTVATPIVNHPQVAIVALGKIQRLPRFDEQDNVTAVNIMNVNWSGDHRVIDGATMVRFNNTWMNYLMHPVQMLSSLR